MPKGANFCHVERISALLHGRLLITEGNQLWNGDAPSFINIAVIKRGENGT